MHKRHHQIITAAAFGFKCAAHFVSAYEHVNTKIAKSLIRAYKKVKVVFANGLEVLEEIATGLKRSTVAGVARVVAGLKIGTHTALHIQPIGDIVLQRDIAQQTVGNIEPAKVVGCPVGVGLKHIALVTQFGAVGLCTTTIFACNGTPWNGVGEGKHRKIAVAGAVAQAWAVFGLCLGVLSRHGQGQFLQLAVDVEVNGLPAESSIRHNVGIGQIAYAKPIVAGLIAATECQRIVDAHAGAIKVVDFYTRVAVRALHAIPLYNGRTVELTPPMVVANIQCVGSVCSNPAIAAGTVLVLPIKAVNRVVPGYIAVKLYTQALAGFTGFGGNQYYPVCRTSAVKGCCRIAL